MSWTNKYRSLAFMAAGFFVMVGTYNAVIINSESHLYGNDVKFVKRLDELYGVTVPGREAASIEWRKLGSASVKKVKLPKEITQEVSKIAAAPVIENVVNDVPSAAIQEELQLSLSEVINTKKWKEGLPADKFTGSLVTNNGVIESLAVDLPNGEGLSVSFSEMTGNVFEYDLNGELYSGMMYQVDQHSYMVTLSNGPLEGTRLRFSGGSPDYIEQQTREQLAQNNIEAGNFGNNADEYERQVQAEEAQYEMVRNQVESGVEQVYENPSEVDQQLQQESLQAQAQIDQPNSEVATEQYQ